MLGKCYHGAPLGKQICHNSEGWEIQVKLASGEDFLAASSHDRGQKGER
jgi:hypothetical protein